MQPAKAREVMGVSRDCSLRELNKQYRILALRLHPDKNGDTPEATLAFQELNTAYQLLLSSAPAHDANDANDASGHDDAPNAANANATYAHIFTSFITSLFRTKTAATANATHLDADRRHALLDLLYRIVHDYASLSVSAALDALDPSALFQLYETLEQYNAAICMDARIFKEITHLIREKMQKNNIVVLNPSLKDVLQNNISVLHFGKQTFYVPLWHSELHYHVDGSDKQLIVKCMPVLPDHMTIDVNNELHIDVRADVKELLNRSSGALRIPLYDDVCVELKTADLRILPRQTVVLQNNAHGISLICANDIYEVSKRAPICVHVCLV
jgi:hypothetical protein